MPTFIPAAADQITKTVNGKRVSLLSKDAYARFDTTLLGLGDLSQGSRSTDAIAAIFDLEGFTSFAKQIEPHLSVPLFLNEFLAWLMDALKKEMTKKQYREGVELWCPLPFFVKFMGDGLLVLWDISKRGDIAKRNIVFSAHSICVDYGHSFLKRIRSKVTDPPMRLRCGLACGTVFSVGNGADYVGSCINMAARLQKIGGVTFAFNRRGFDLESPKIGEFFTQKITVKEMPIRGIGDHELVALLKTEFESMKPKERNAIGIRDL